MPFPPLIGRTHSALKAGPWERAMSTFVIYAIGFVILLAGLIYGAVLLNVPTQWIVVGSLVLLGLGIAMGVGKTRVKDVPTDQT
jgi:hypothetical protein